MESYTPYIIAETLTVATPGKRCLASMQTGTLVDGTHAYVLENKTEYVLDKTSVADPTGGLVAANNGGNWFPVGSIASSFGSLNVLNASNKALTLTGVGNFLPLTSGAASFVKHFGGAGWGVDLATGVATWNGAPDSLFAVTADVSLQNDTANIETLMGLGISSDNPQDFQAKQQANAVPGGTAFYQLSICGIVRLGQGDTIKLLFAGGNSNILITNLSYVLTPLS